MPSGGPRQGSVGTLYPNRGDMAAQPIATPKGQTYGTATAQAQSQAIVPVAGSATPRPNAQSGPPSTNTANGTVVSPGSIPSLQDPTAYPNQPVTAGLPNSPGAGPEVLSTPAMAMAPMELQFARYLYGKYKHPSLLGVIDFMQGKL